MYEELIQSLREKSEFLTVTDVQKAPPGLNIKNLFAETMKEAADAIEAMCDLVATYEDRQRWIPVTERLPECEVGAEIGNVEWISHDMVCAGCFGRGGKYRDAYFRTWTDTTEGIDAKDADCWRVVTLPEPPKEADNG